MENEYEKIHALCQDQKVFGIYHPNGITKTRPYMSYSELLQEYFLLWPLRGTFTSVEEMLCVLEISENDFKKEATEERMLDYLQFTLNAILFLNAIAEGGIYSVYKSTDIVGDAIWKNCHYVADRLGAEVKKDRQEIYLVYKDNIAAAMCNEIPDIEASITEYQKIDSHGDITRKAEILCTLAKKLEPYEGQLKKAGFNDLCSDTTFLLNKVARHDLRETDIIDKRFRELDDRDLEEWCDSTFKLFLGCMAVIPYTEMKKEIKALRRTD